MVDFGRQSSRAENVWVDECLDERYKLQYAASSVASESLQKRLNKVSVDFAKGLPRRHTQTALTTNNSIDTLPTENLNPDIIGGKKHKKSQTSCLQMDKQRRRDNTFYRTGEQFARNI